MKNFESKGHGVNGSMSVSKTDGPGSNPGAPATLSLEMVLVLGIPQGLLDLEGDCRG
jgi:hypothetical protein